MSGLRVRIGPSVDRAAFDAAFAKIASDAKRAFAAATNEAVASGNAEVKAVTNTASQVTRIRGQARRREETEDQRMLRTLEAAERMKARLAQRAAREKTAADVAYYRGLSRQHREAEQSSARMYAEFKRQARDAANAAKMATMQARPRFGVSLGHGASVAMSGVFGAGAAAMRMGMGIAGDIARAYGVNTSFGEAMRRNNDLDTLAVQVTNEAHEKGQAFASADDLKSKAFDVGNKTGFAANDVMKGFQEFVGRTGDLETITGSMEDLAKVAKGTGANLQDVVGAAASVSNQLGNIPNKAAKVNEVMRILAGESKLGAVSMRSLAAQAPKIVAQAQLMEGDVAKNMGLLGAVAQEAGLRGGSANAAQSATAVTSLMNTFGKQARVHAFQKLGINLAGAGGKQRNIEDVIVESLQKTQRGSNATASNLAFGSLFADARARNAVRGFETIFRTTYASSTKGTEQERLADATAAVRAEFERLQKAAMDQKEVDDSFARAMKTGQSQAELWNNATQQAADKMQKALLPAIISLTPAVVGAAQTFTNVIDMITGKKHDPDGTALRQDMDAIHKAQKSGQKIDPALRAKAIADAQKLGAQATTLENEARGMKDHRFGNMLLNAGNAAGAKHNAYDVTGLGTLYDFAKELTSGRAGAKADKDQQVAADKAKQAGDESMRAFTEAMHLNTEAMQKNTEAMLHGTGGAGNHATDSLSPNPSGH